MKLLDYFKNFLENTVNLNQTRIDKLNDSVDAITDYLEAHAELGPIFIEIIPQGSFAHRTIIKPVGRKEFDADILLHISEQAHWEPADYVENLYQAFRDSGTYKAMVRRRTRCVLVNYADDFHVDVVPYLVRDDGHWITNRSENVFEPTNPAGFTEWLDEQDATANRHLVEAIRILKYLRDTGQLGIRSVILTLLVAERVDETLLLGDPDHYADLPTALVNIVEALNDYLQANVMMPPLIDPTCPAQTFNHRWSEEGYTAFRDRIQAYAEKMREAFDETSAETSLGLWQELFGLGFCKAATVPAKRYLTAAGVEPRDQEQSLPYPIRQTPYRVRISARVTTTNKRSARRGFRRNYSLSQTGGWVPKGCDLHFKALTNVTGDYQLFWKIKNEGEEAAKADQLRGQIQAGTPGQEHFEQTLYRGNHYVECYIVQNGICIAQNHRRVTIV
jgi:hypothetical protein